MDLSSTDDSKVETLSCSLKRVLQGVAELDVLEDVLISKDRATTSETTSSILSEDTQTPDAVERTSKSPANTGRLD